MPGQRGTADIKHLDFKGPQAGLEAPPDPVFPGTPVESDSSAEGLIFPGTAVNPEQLPPAQDPRLVSPQTEPGPGGEVLGTDLVNRLESSGELGLLEDPTAGGTKIPLDVVFASAIKNTPASGQKFVKDIATALSDPMGVAKSLGELGKGAAVKTAQALGFDANDADAERAFDALIDFAVDRYGGIEETKRTLATDPVGFMMDLSLVLTAGGSAGAQVPGTIGKVSKAVRAAGRAVDPVQGIMKTASPVSRVAQRGAAEIGGLFTGTGGRPLMIGFNAGKKGGPALRAFKDSLRGNTQFTEIVGAAKEAFTELRLQRGARYRSGFTKISGDKTVLSMNQVGASTHKALSKFAFKGQAVSPEVGKVGREIAKIVKEHARRAPKEFHTPEGMDFLKQQIGAVRNKLPFGSRERAMAGEVYDSVRGVIVKQSPEYAKIMSDYERASSLIEEIGKTLSLKPTATVDTQIRKLGSIMRDNVNASFGRRFDLAAVLADQLPNNLIQQIAGSSLSSMAPQGLARLSSPAADVGAVVGVMSGLLNPAALAILPASSPRIAGEVAAAAGQASRVTAPAAVAAQQSGRAHEQVLGSGPRPSFVGGGR